MDNLKKRLFDLFSSLHLTVWLLGFSLLVVFFGTLDQVRFGIQHTQDLYFESLVVLTPFVSLMKMFIFRDFDHALQWIILPLPGGLLLGLMLLANLLCAHFRYFRKSWDKAGIAVTHAGVLMLLVSGFVVGFLQEEYRLTFSEDGPAVNYLESFYDTELAFSVPHRISQPDGKTVDAQKVYAVNFSDLRTGKVFELGDSGLRLRPVFLAENAIVAPRSMLVSEAERSRPHQKDLLADPSCVALGLDGRSGVTRTPGLDLKGMAARMDAVIWQQPKTYRQEESNTPAALIEVLDGERSAGVWMFTALSAPGVPVQQIEGAGKTCTAELRPRRTYLPYALELKDFKHDRYPGTEIARNFSSDILIHEGKASPRSALIFMNNPLRYEGLAFYQASFANDDRTSILQVVQNPAWQLPYWAVLVVGIGLLVQFSLSLARHLSRQKTRLEGTLEPEAALPKAAAASPLASRLGFGAAAVVVVWLFWSGLKAPQTDGFDWKTFGEIPVQAGGRLLPLDALARNELRLLRGRSTVPAADGRKLTAIEWLAAVAFSPEKADPLPVFRMDHPELVALLGKGGEDAHYFSMRELIEHYESIDAQARAVNPDAQRRTSFERAVVRLREAMSRYSALVLGFVPPGDAAMLPREYGAWADLSGRVFAQMRLNPQSDGHPDGAFLGGQRAAAFSELLKRYEGLVNRSTPGISPPLTPDETSSKDWATLSEALLAHTPLLGQVPPALSAYGRVALAWQKADVKAFNAEVRELHRSLIPETHGTHVTFEAFFNRMDPFMASMMFYVSVSLLALVGWLRKLPWATPATLWLLAMAFGLHTFGLVSRMIIQDRPPVTNLYSAAVFTGWVAAGVGLIMERINRNGLAALTSGLVGFATLVVAYNLAATGDTLQLMVAVLDSNFWLATHVVTVTIGYGAMFLGGMLGAALLIRGWFGKLPAADSTSLSRMIYGVTCFGLLFSFIGTMLGGVWADQSWGRFWGWDPKENGALMIVLWAALMLHARWGGLLKSTGMAQLAVGGNIVTAWSFFGTNQLGVGLHSYGFTDSGMIALVGFWLSQFFLIALPWLKLIGSPEKPLAAPETPEQTA